MNHGFKDHFVDR